MVLSDKIAIMRAGTLQQYGTPREIYNDPVNMYVAGFIGSPAMNFLSVTAALDNGAIACQGDNFVARIPARRANGLASGNSSATLGIRPEGVIVTPDPAVGDFSATVVLTEPVGPVTYVNLRLGAETIKATGDSELELEPEAAVGVRFNPNKVYLFNPQTGARL